MPKRCSLMCSVIIYAKPLMSHYACIVRCLRQKLATFDTRWIRIISSLDSADAIVAEFNRILCFSRQSIRHQCAWNISLLFDCSTHQNECARLFILSGPKNVLLRIYCSRAILCVVSSNISEL